MLLSNNFSFSFVSRCLVLFSDIYWWIFSCNFETHGSFIFHHISVEKHSFTNCYDGGPRYRHPACKVCSDNIFFRPLFDKTGFLCLSMAFLDLTRPLKQILPPTSYLYPLRTLHSVAIDACFWLAEFCHLMSKKVLLFSLLLVPLNGVILFYFACRAV